MFLLKVFASHSALYLHTVIVFQATIFIQRTIHNSPLLYLQALLCNQVISLNLDKMILKQTLAFSLQLLVLLAVHLTLKNLKANLRFLYPFLEEFQLSNLLSPRSLVTVLEFRLKGSNSCSQALQLHVCLRSSFASTRCLSSQLLSTFHGAILGFQIILPPRDTLEILHLSFHSHFQIHFPQL